MKRLILPLLLVLLSCNVNSRKLIKFSYKGGDIKYAFYLPEGYTESIVRGSGYFSQNYLYPDSLLFYITDFRVTLNYKEIRKDGNYYDRFNALNNEDSLTLSGVDSTGLYWKDRLLNTGITIGYTKVPKARLSEFDAAIYSIEKK